MRRAFLVFAATGVAAVVLQVGAAASVSGSWTALAPLPTARYGLAATSANGHVYALGGSDANGDVLKTNEAYNAATNTWSPAAPLPIERIRPAVLTGPDGKVWVVGGRNDSNFPVDAVNVYDPTTGTWSTPTSVPTHRGDAAAAFGGDGRLYVIGGCCDANGALPVVEAYDPSTSSWSSAPPIPVAVYQAHAVEGPNGRIYVIGGSTATGFLNTVQIYDPGTTTWSQGAAAPLVFGGQEAAATLGADGLIYVVGGFQPNGLPSSAGAAYDPGTDTWSGVGGCPEMTARSDLAAASLGGRIYAIGGASHLDVLSTVESLAPAVSGGGTISVTPDQIGQNGVRNGVITGSGFNSSAVVSFCPGGVTAVNTTIPSGSKIKTTFKADAAATPGPRTVIVTLADGSSSSCAGCLTVNPGPRPTSASPAGLPPGAHMDVNIFGSGFQNGAKVGITCGNPLCKPGVTVNSVTFAGSTHLVVNITVAPGTAASPRTIAVTNPDTGRGTCDCFAIQQQAKLAFTTNRDGNYEVYLANPNGTGLVNLTNNPAQDGALAGGVAWSPDNSRIAFVRDDGGIYVMNADGSGQRHVVEGFDPLWSPDGSRVAYDCGGDVCSIRPDGSGLVNLTNRDSSPDRLLPAYLVLDWSPDGSEVLISALHGEPQREDLFVARPDGSTLTQLATSPCPADPFAGFSAGTWSPDGTRIVYTLTCGGINNIGTMNADGTGATPLTSTGDNDDPAWSPDGKTIAFESYRNGNEDIWTMNADGSGKTRLTTAAGADGDPVWSPDGSSIAYVSRRWCLQKVQNWDVFVMNARGGAQTNVSSSCADDISPVWQH